MRTTMMFVPLALIAIAGCTPQQQSQVDANVNNAAQNAQHGLQSATASASKTLSDESVAMRVKTAMSASKTLDTSNLTVTVNNQIVTLAGSVKVAQQKQLAERITTDTVAPGTKIVNALQVQAPAAAGQTASSQK